MSWDLAFWKPDRTASESAEEVYAQLCEDQEPDGLGWLRVDDVKSRFQAAFPDIVDDGTELNWDGSGSYFQATWSVGSKPQHTLGVLVSCGWDLAQQSGIIERIRAVGAALGCGVYDPQSDEWSAPG